MVGEKEVSVSEDQHELLKNVVESHELNLMIIPPVYVMELTKRICIQKLIQEECDGTP